MNPTTSIDRPDATDSWEPARTPSSYSASRLLGVDLARGIAVFGMFAAHVGPDPAGGGLKGSVMEVFHGRSSALFALLAGFTVVLLTGRSQPKTGLAGRQAVAKIVVRAGILLVAGSLLTMSGTPVEVILASYGLYFVLVLPLCRCRAKALILVALTSAAVLPQVLYVSARQLGYTDVTAIGGAPGILDLLLTGSYPALSWVPFVIFGMAIARLDLKSAQVRLRCMLGGLGLAALGYGGSWLALHLVPGAMEAIRTSTGSTLPTVWWSDVTGYPDGDTAAWLLAASPHSETTLSILGNAGAAMVVLAGCLIAVERSARVRTWTAPVVAVGTMSLTAYVLHIVGIGVLGIEELPGSPLHVLFGFIVSVTLFATLWRRVFTKGPLEWLMAQASDSVARRVW